MISDADDGQVTCRICRMPERAQSVLYSPCKCSGSIKYVHQDCLIQWLNHSGHQSCELCRHKFTFRPVYAPDAPSSLPLLELIWGLAVKSVATCSVGARVLVVAFTWLFCVPLATCWMWRMAFLTSFSQGMAGIVSRLQPILILADCIQGSLISSALIFLILFSTYTYDYVRAYLQIMQPLPPQQLGDDMPPPQGPRNPPNPRAPTEEGEEQPSSSSSGMAAMAAAPSSSLPLAPEGSASQAERLYSGMTASTSDLTRSAMFDSDSDNDEGEVTSMNRASPTSSSPSSFAFSQGSLGGASSSGGRFGDASSLGDQGEGGGPQNAAARVRNRAHQDDAGPQRGGALVPQPALRPPPRNIAPRAPAEDHEFAFNELIGLDGPLRMLLENAATVIFTTWAFLTAALWMPFMLGRMIIATLLGLQVSWTGLDGFNAATHSIESLLRSAKMPGGSPGLGNATSAQAHSLEGLGAKVALVPLLNRLAAEFEAHLSGPDLSDWICLAVGYGLLVVLAALAFWTVVCWKLFWSTNWREGLRGQRAAIQAVLIDISRQTRMSIGYIAVMAKVTVVLTLELTLLPIIHGFWVDVCLLPLGGGTWPDRLAWLHSSPISFLLLHWVLGMAFLMGVASFLSLLRQQLRPGALPFFKDPYDGDEEPMRALMILGLGQQLEREVCALSALACLTVILLHLPLRLTKTLMPGALPLRFHLSTPYAEAPADLLLFHFLLPFTLPHLHLRSLIAKGLRIWLRGVSRALDLSDYLLPHDRLDDQPPPIIPMGLLDEEAGQDPAFQAEVARARERSGRLMALLVALLLSLALVNAAVLNLPLLTGRAAFQVLNTPLQHDLYNLVVGAYIIWGAVLAARQLGRMAQAPSFAAAASAAAAWVATGGSLAVLSVLALGVLPLLVGASMELLLMPFRLREGETPSLFLYQDWALGLLALKMGYRLLLGWPQRPNAPPAPPVLPPTQGGFVSNLRMHVLRIKADGISRLRFLDALVHVIWPLVALSGSLLAAPYVVSRGIAPWLGLRESSLHALFLYGWVAEGCVVIGWHGAFKAAAGLESLSRSLRDQKYLLRQELTNAD